MCSNYVVIVSDTIGYHGLTLCSVGSNIIILLETGGSKITLGPMLRYMKVPQLDY